MLYISLRQYEYVVAVADAKSLTEAAARICVSQPSLSVAITRVEEHLGSVIFVRRKGAAIEITPFGHRFVDRARALLHQAEMLERVKGAPLPFVLGCFEDIAPWYLAPSLEKLSTAFPGAEFDGKEGRFSDLAEGLARGRIDVVITYDIGFDGRYERRTIGKIAPVAFVSADHQLAARSTIELADLAPYPLLLFSEPLSERFVQNLFHKMRLKPEVRQRASSLELMRSLAAHGAGIGISYSCPPGGTSYDGRPVVTIPITTSEAETDLKLVWSSLREADPRFREFLDVLT